MEANRILFFAAENGALPNGKVGGVGDVIRDLPRALSERGLDTAVLIPAYGVLADLPKARHAATVRVPFDGTTEAVELFEIDDGSTVSQYVVDHPRFAPRGPGQIYCDDAADAPFATDASKFAFYCAVAATLLDEGNLPAPDVVHLHDWPTAFFLLLREFDSRLARLKKLPVVFTIHNVALQGVRPLDGHPSSLKGWFPWLTFDEETVVDPRWQDCINPIAAAIRLADKVNTVSPSYAQEILLPNAPEHGFYGGEGLEADLRKVHEDGRLFGILNGCVYPPRPKKMPAWSDLLATMRRETAAWLAAGGNSAEALRMAESRLAAMPERAPRVLLTNIGRLGVQKTRLFREPVADGVSALAAILDFLGDDGLFLMLGSGDPNYEAFLAGTMAARRNFLFLRGYSDTIAERIYSVGDLFLMPSSFEPCGISQLLAMRAGQPCVVHGVGGLKDTVRHGDTGFVFDGENAAAQAESFVDTVLDALAMRTDTPDQWRRLRERARKTRFSWDASAEEYERVLYGFGQT